MNGFMASLQTVEGKRIWASVKFYPDMCRTCETKSTVNPGGMTSYMRKHHI